jgi:hypothetical protein
MEAKQAKGARWIEREWSGLDLGDRRRNRRARRLLHDLARRPELSIPQACGGEVAKSKAAYRLLSSEIDPTRLRTPHEAATAERAREAARVLVVEDTTNLAFTTHPSMRGVGPLDDARSKGLKVQSSLVLTEQGLPLGVLDQRVWARDASALGQRHRRRARAPEEKESWRWRVGVERAQEKLPEDVEVIWIADRESDIYHVLATPRRAGMELLIRATHNRALEESGGAKLHERVSAAPRLGAMEVELKRTRKRRARTARLALSSVRVKIAPPRHAKKRSDLPPVALWAVLAEERTPARKGQTPIRWMLLSTRPVQTLAEARECVALYTERWKVERYHYVLKSGCRIEALQLESAERLERALVLYSLIAYRLLSLTYRARLSPRAPCSEALQEVEWKALYAIGTGEMPSEAPPLAEAVRRIAKLGGFLGRRGDKEPGVKTLWSGWRRLEDFVLAFERLSPTCG